jgi:hypothetical protein
MSNSPHMLALPLPARSTLSPAARPGHAVRFASPMLWAVLLLCSLPLSLACGQTGSPFSQLPSGLISERWNGNPAGYPAGFPASPGDATPCMQWDASAPGGGAWVGSPLPLPEGTVLKDVDMSAYRPLRGGSGTTVRASYFTGSCDNSGQTNGIMEQRCPAQQQSGVLPIQITLPMARYAGPVDGNGYLDAEKADSLIDRDGLIAPNATIRLQFRNKGYENTLPYIGGWPQGAVVKLNGVICNVVDGDSAPEPLGNNGLVLPTARRWRTATFTCPVRAVKFPELGPPEGTPTPRPNVLEIDLSGLPTGPNGQLPNFCLLVADAELSVKVYSPLVLVHGIRDDAASWNARQFRATLDSHAIHFESVDFGEDENAQSPGRPGKLSEIARAVSEAANRTGSRSVAFVCHSMGGLDVLAAMADPMSVLSLVDDSLFLRRVTLYATLGTPFNGSPLADLVTKVRDTYERGGSPMVWERDDSNLNGAAAWAALDLSTAALKVWPNGFPTGWRAITPSVATATSSERTRSLQAKPGEVFGVAFAADADRNGDRTIQVSPIPLLDEGGSLPGWWGRVLGIDPGFFVSPALTNTYRLVCSGARFEATVREVEMGFSETWWTQKQIRISTTLGPPEWSADIIVARRSAFGTGSAAPLLRSTFDWSDDTGRNHTDMRDVQAVLQLIPQLREADSAFGELR